MEHRGHRRADRAGRDHASRPGSAERPLNGVLARPAADALGLAPLRPLARGAADYMGRAGLADPPLSRVANGSSSSISRERGRVRVALRRDQLDVGPLDPDVGVVVPDARARWSRRSRPSTCTARPRCRWSRRSRARSRSGSRAGAGSRRSARTPPTARRSASPGGGRRPRPRSRRGRSEPASPSRRRPGSASRGRPVLRARMVVLDELVGDAELREHVATVALVEEAALVAVNDGTDSTGPSSLVSRRSMATYRTR